MWPGPTGTSPYHDDSTKDYCSARVWEVVGESHERDTRKYFVTVMLYQTRCHLFTISRLTLVVYSLKIYNVGDCIFICSDVKNITALCDKVIEILSHLY